MRKTLLRLHLAAGLAAGLVLLFMASTGILIAFAPQLAAWAESGSSRASSAAGAPALPPSALATHAAAALPPGKLVGLAFRNEPGAAVFAATGKAGGVWLDPATGAVLGESSRLRAWMAALEHWHRWMGEEKRGKWLTNASALLLIFLVPSGWLLWIPLRRSGWKRAFLPCPKPKSLAGSRNLHRTLGFWSGAALLIIGTTGAVMAYGWAEAGLYALAGDKAPPKRAGPTRAAQGEKAPAVWEAAAFDPLFAASVAKAPGWTTITLRPPRETGKPATAQIEEKGFLYFPRRSRLNADAVTGAPGKFEPWRDQSKGQRWRASITPLHTGRGFGWPGQSAAALAALSLLLLSWTGLKLGLNRLRRPKPAKSTQPPVPEHVAEGGR